MANYKELYELVTEARQLRDEKEEILKERCQIEIVMKEKEITKESPEEGIVICTFQFEDAVTETTILDEYELGKKTIKLEVYEKEPTVKTPHFHLSGNKLYTAIKFERPEYLIHDTSRSILSGKHVEMLNDLLGARVNRIPQATKPLDKNREPIDGKTIYELAKNTWNYYERQHGGRAIVECSKPNYLFLKNDKPKGANKVPW